MEKIKNTVNNYSIIMDTDKLENILNKNFFNSNEDENRDIEVFKKTFLDLFNYVFDSVLNNNLKEEEIQKIKQIYSKTDLEQFIEKKISCIKKLLTKMIFLLKNKKAIQSLLVFFKKENAIMEFDITFNLFHRFLVKLDVFYKVFEKEILLLFDAFVNKKSKDFFINIENILDTECVGNVNNF